MRKHSCFLATISSYKMPISYSKTHPHTFEKGKRQLNENLRCRRSRLGHLQQYNPNGKCTCSTILQYIQHLLEMDGNFSCSFFPLSRRIHQQTHRLYINFRFHINSSISRNHVRPLQRVLIGSLPTYWDLEAVIWAYVEKITQHVRRQKSFVLWKNSPRIKRQRVVRYL